MSFEKLSANAEILVLAGSETTATLLSGCTYLLLTNPDKMEKLKHEVRSKFGSESEITASSVNNLTYMLGVLNEALRLYPPVTSSLVRVVPQGGDRITDIWVPEGVSRSLDPAAFSLYTALPKWSSSTY
jgi:cytochrome P450